MSEKFVLSTPFSLYNETVVLKSEGDSIVFGLLDSSNESLKERLAKSVANFFRGSGKQGSCEFVQISREEFEKVASLQYGLTEDDSNVPVSRESEKEKNYHAAVLLLDSLLDEACRCGATDIHIEEKAVRFRAQGILYQVCPLAPERSRELIRRIKMLAKLDVLHQQKGQDGQFVAKRQTAPGKKLAEEGQLFVRVSIIPALSGDGEGLAESVVLRLLDAARTPLDFASLGFSKEQSAILNEFAMQKNGLVLLCGATGSGKSTTAAAMLMAAAKDARRKIITIEEPPEYILPGVTQIAVNGQFGLDFSDALRLIFRQDPDVIFIGEIRDEETARTALQAAVTGHLVFATMHTGGFYESLVRLGQLGSDAKEIATVLRGIIVQELESDGKKVQLHARILRAGENISWSLCTASSPADVQNIIQEAVL